VEHEQRENQASIGIRFVLMSAGVLMIAALAP